MTDPPKTIKRRWRSYLRLFLQVMVVLFGAIAGWMGWVLYTGRVQHHAVVAIEKIGGSVIYDWELRDGPLLSTPKPWWLKWLVDHLGADSLSNVVLVRFHDKGSDAELALVGKLGLVYHLNASGTSITEAGLVHLKRLTQLTELNLCGTAISDAGLVHLKRLTRLQRLSLSGTAIADAGLAHLQGLTDLWFLTLANNRVTDSGRASLERMVNLKLVSLWKTAVTNAGVQKLRKALPGANISY